MCGGFSLSWGGNKAEAARVLNIDRRTLYAKLADAEEETRPKQG